MEDNILKDLFGDQEGVISESAQNLILEAFNKKVNEVTTERVDLALEAMDKDHTSMLQTLVEKYENKILVEKKELEELIDEEHAQAVKETFDKVDENRASKIVQVKEHYETLLNEKVSNQVDVLVEGVDSFLNAFLDKHVPTDLIAEAAKKDYSQELIKKISKLVTLDEEVSDDIRNGMIDAKKTIEEQKSEIVNLRRKNILAEKTAKLPTLEKNFMLESLKDKDVAYIERNFDYVKTLFGKKEEVVEEQTSTQNVDRKPVVIEESTNGNDEKEVTVNSAMAGWTNSVVGKSFYD